MKCPYCRKNADWVENKTIYGRNYGRSYMVWLCGDCDAWVGCHRNTQRALGTMANKELRELRIKCHDKFDKLWKETNWTRGQAYEWLQSKMKLHKTQAHIAKFDKKMCLKFLRL